MRAKLRKQKKLRGIIARYIKTGKATDAEYRFWGRFDIQSFLKVTEKIGSYL